MKEAVSDQTRNGLRGKTLPTPSFFHATAARQAHVRDSPQAQARDIVLNRKDGVGSRLSLLSLYITAAVAVTVALVVIAAAIVPALVPVRRVSVQGSPLSRF